MILQTAACTAQPPLAQPRLDVFGGGFYFPTHEKVSASVGAHGCVTRWSMVSPFFA